MILEISFRELEAVSRMVIEARSLAYVGEDTTQIARILDEVDGLLGILMYRPANDADYRDVLVELGKFYPRLSGLVDQYDKEAPSSALSSVSSGREAA